MDKIKKKKEEEAKAKALAEQRKNAQDGSIVQTNETQANLLATLGNEEEKVVVKKPPK